MRGKRVVLKPNLVEFDAHTVINTNPKLVHAALEAFRAAGAADVRIAEGPGHRRVTLDLADAGGYFATVPKFESLFTDLNLDETTRVDLVRPQSKLESLYLPNTVLGCDLLVSMPKLKTHHWAGATLSMKNLFGVVPGGVYGWPKNVLHWAGIPECIADLHALFPKSVRDRRRHRRDGRQRPHSGHAAHRRRGSGGSQSGGRGRHLLPHHGPGPRAHPLSATHGWRTELRRGIDPATGRADRKRRHRFAVLPELEGLRLSR